METVISQKEVETKVLNQAVKRNIERFPSIFRFQLSGDERSELVTICDRFDSLKHATVNPYAFTEQGVAMLSAVLRSETAIKVCIQIMTAFVEIDNYVDETVLTLLTKRSPGVEATIYTQKITPQLQLDLNKHNAQYPAIQLKILADSHDRFLLIDDKELYHIGASLKDQGKKWFAFSRMDSMTNEILNKLN
jgi:hypothetical protein